jgi:hypothetical protein
VGVDWQTNSKGFRDYEHEVAKDGYRILALGDSFFVGHEVSFEDSFLRRLERCLNVEVIKMAVTNYGTVQERLVWEEEGRQYHPDVVMLGVYVGNDLQDNVLFRQTCIYRGNFVRCGDPSSVIVRISRFLAYHSLFARFLLQRFYSFLPQSDATPPGKETGKGHPVFKNLNEQKTPYMKVWPGILKKGFALLEEEIVHLNRSITAHEAVLLVIIIPTELQIYDWQWDLYLKDFSRDDSLYDRYGIIHSISKLLEREKIHHINLLPNLKKAAEVDEDLHPNHWHWSVKANDVVADTVESYLRRHKLVPLTQ